jgi:hypothetical protein
MTGPLIRQRADMAEFLRRTGSVRVWTQDSADRPLVLCVHGDRADYGAAPMAQAGLSVAQAQVLLVDLMDGLAADCGVDPMPLVRRWEAAQRETAAAAGPAHDEAGGNLDGRKTAAAGGSFHGRRLL